MVDTYKIWLKRHRPWLAVILTVLLVLVVRVRLREIPLERDEGEYAYAGQLMLQHIPPYKFAYNMKLPGTYAAYAMLMGIFGETPWGIHVGVLFVNAGTIVLVFLLGSRLFGRTAGVVAAATYGLLSTHQQTLGFAGHATHFVIIAAIAGLIVLLRAIEGVLLVRLRCANQTQRMLSPRQVRRRASAL